MSQSSSENIKYRVAMGTGKTHIMPSAHIDHDKIDILVYGTGFG